MKDKIAYLADLVIGFGLGYGMTIAVGLYRTRGVTPRRWRRLWDFIQEHGPDTSMFAAFAIPAAVLGGLIWCAPLLLLLDVAFGVKFDGARRLTFIGVAIVATYVGYLLAIAYNLVRDTRTR